MVTMRNLLKIILVIWLSVGILGCSKNDQEYEVKNNKEKSSVNNEMKHSVDVNLDEKSEEIVFHGIRKIIANMRQKMNRNIRFKL